MQKKDLYEILGVQPDAGHEEIKTAFRKAAVKLHPDLNPGNIKAESDFKELNGAYQVLSDETKRKAYDEARNLSTIRGRVGDPWTTYQAARGSPDMQDIYDSFFIHATARRARANANARASASTPWGDSISPTRGKDLEREIVVSFEESFTGVVKTIRTKFGGEEKCGTCSGNGGMSGSRYMPCGACAGGNNPGVGKCRNCHGHGDVPTHVCTSCSGSGMVKKERDVRLRIPSGIEEGQKLRLAGMGAPGVGGLSGDLYVTVRVAPHDRYRRRGRDVFVSRMVSFAEALAGRQVFVDSPDGKSHLVGVPEELVPGVTEVKVRGAGFSTEASGAGDMRVTFQVELPKVKTARASKLLQELLDELERPLH